MFVAVFGRVFSTKLKELLQLKLALNEANFGNDFGKLSLGNIHSYFDDSRFFHFWIFFEKRI